MALVHKDSTPELNLSPAELADLTSHTQRLNLSAFQHQTSERLPQNITTQSPYEHGGVGTEYDSTSSYNGVYSVQSADDGFRLANSESETGTDPNGNPTYNTVFRATTKAPGGNCFESGTGIWSDLQAFYVFDFCNHTQNNIGKFVVVKPFSSAFQKYFQGNDTSGTATYTMENYKGSDGNWHALLYNFSTKAWETEYTESGSLVSSQGGSQFTYGWSMSEYYNAPNQQNNAPGYCQVIGFDSLIGQFVATTANSRLLSGSTMYNVTTGNSGFLNTNNDGGVATCLSAPGNASYPDYQFTFEGTGGAQVPGDLWQITTTYSG